MSDRRREVEEIKQGLKDRIEDLCRKLLPDGRRQGRLWVSNNPVTGDHKKTPELKVAVTGDKGVSTMERVRRTYAAKGVRGFYPGGTAIAFRQATNWASRQGFTEAVRERLKLHFHGSADATLTRSQEVCAGVVGGTLACWNHPFEMARIEAQARAEAGQKALSMPGVFSLVLKEQGPAGLFAGVIPRIGLGIWQTLFMVTGAKIVKQELRERGIID